MLLIGVVVKWCSQCLFSTGTTSPCVVFQDGLEALEVVLALEVVAFDVVLDLVVDVGRS